MATWSEVAAYVRSRYSIASDEPTLIKMIFDLGESRSQLVLLTRSTPSGYVEEEWLHIEAPFADLGAVDLEKAIKKVSEYVCGGVCSLGNVLVIRHAVPLENLNVNELERPLEILLLAADMIERELVGGDKY